MQNDNFLSYIIYKADSEVKRLKKAELDLCIKRLAEKDKDYLSKLYHEMNKPIFLFALSIVKDYALAEDVSQETFIRIMAYAHTYRLGTNPMAWIFKISRNVINDALKKSKHETSLDMESLIAAIDMTGEQDEPYHIESLEALEILDPIEREIVSLYVYSGLKQTEIAKVLGLPYLKVRAKYGYAIAKLKKYYRRGEINE